MEHGGAGRGTEEVGDKETVKLKYGGERKRAETATKELEDGDEKRTIWRRKTENMETKNGEYGDEKRRRDGEESSVSCGLPV